MRVRGYRFFFYSNEGSEPPHVHVERAEFSAKFWLRPVESAAKTRFDDRELRALRRLIERGVSRSRRPGMSTSVDDAVAVEAQIDERDLHVR
ncbi:DUF4160 domain-containing protein [Microbacterium sp. 2RAF4]|uniref:DUF4160 domain-containing protein n=1 Tax=Microbacterium sp. 2RAF4 TaxID=3232999 RepID=UPI003F98CC7F